MLIQEEPADLLPELPRRAREGDADAFCELVNGCERRLFQQAFALCRNPDAAEDLAAETIIEAWKSLARFDGRCRFSTWLYAILVHRFQKHVRSARSRPIPLASLSHEDATDRESLLERMPDTRPNPADDAGRQEASRRMLAAIAALPVKHQQVVLMRFYESASIPEIAAALDLPGGTVKSRLHNAMEMLRNNTDLLNVLEEKGDISL